MNVEQVARWLNRAGLNAAACGWLPAVSIFVDEFYDNHDYDLLHPSARLRIAAVLKERGFRQRSGRRFEGPAGRIEFPRPPRLLSSDPLAELEEAVRNGADAVFATPTQVVLATWRREGPELGDARQRELRELVREQPANLDKVGDWLRRTASGAEYARFKPELAAAQEEGFQLRRTGRFRSSLPR